MQYKFRAMRSDWENKWVYGNLITTPEGTFILEEGDSVEYNEPEFHSVGMGCGLEDRNITDRYEAMKYGWDCAVEKCCELFPPFIPVKPKTVGMWTGLKDKKGVEIYEGDIYLAERSFMSSRGYKRKGYPDRITVICVVEWWKYRAGWHGKEVSVIKEHIEYDKNAPYHYIHTSLEGSTTGNADWVEVIGNIHEHPHLLNPAQGAVINTMNNQFDPNEQKQQEEVVNAQESAAQDAAVEATEGAEEGSTEG